MDVAKLEAFVDLFPGAFPFRVTAPELGAPFVGLLRMLAPDRPFIQVVVEDDDPLRAALLAAGANVS